MAVPAEEIHSVPLNVRWNCICPNGGRPDADGVQVIDPSCRMHYAERAVLMATPDYETGITEAELAEWSGREKKRVTYPKMTVAKR